MILFSSLSELLLVCVFISAAYASILWTTAVVRGESGAGYAADPLGRPRR
jgi:hypothetical protein